MSSTLKSLLSVVTLAAALSAPSHASIIPIQLFNTGVDGAAIPLADGASPDTHYAVSYGAALGSYPTSGAAYAVNDNGVFPMNAYWLQADSSSAWISPFGRNSVDAAANGFYDYRTTFTLQSDQVATASISGLWAADNCGLDILINGVSTGQAMVCAGSNSYSPFASWTSFAIASGFVGGTNTIDFVVENFSQGGGNPTGLRVEMSGITNPPVSNIPGVPEPLTLSLFGAGLAGAALWRRRRKTA